WSVSRVCVFFFSSRRRHTRSKRDWSSDVCSSDLEAAWPDDVPADSPTRRVGGKVNPEFTEVRHLTPLLSLGNAFSDAELVAFDRSEERRVGKEGRSRWAT